MSINIHQLKSYVIDPVLIHLGLNSTNASDIILGTAAQESGLGTYIKQIGFNDVINSGGLGIYQMEINTALDIFRNFLKYKKDLFDKVKSLYAGGDLDDLLDDNPSMELLNCLAYNLIGNLLFSTAMCRIHYFRISEPLPMEDNIEGMARYWKKYYNSDLGKGNIDEFISNYHKYILDK